MNVPDNKICAGIVTFNPDFNRLQKCFDSVISQVAYVIIADNNSSNIAQIIEKYSNNPRVYIIKNSTNAGIAKALNQIFERAKELNFNWVYTLDQDTVTLDGTLENLGALRVLSNVGIICPKVVFNGTNLVHSTKQEYDYIEACMTSGSLTSIKAWEDVKGFDEWMFIDLVDNDFCMRLALLEYKVIRTSKAVMNHELGSQSKVRMPFNKNVLIFNHSHFRNYYYVRNSVYFIRKYHKRINVPKKVSILIYWEFKKILFEKGKLLTLKSAFNGFFDGIKASIS